jgi:hypothetical protein
MVNSSSGGAFLKKTPSEGWALLEDIAKYNYAPSYQAIQAPLPPKIEEVNMQNQLISLLQQQVAALSRNNNSQSVNQIQQNSQVLFCESCNQVGHVQGQCQFNSPQSFPVNAVQHTGQYTQVTCQSCDNVGHTARFCPMNGQNAEVNAFYGQQNSRFNNPLSGQGTYQNQGFNQNSNFNRNPGYNQNPINNSSTATQRFNQNWPSISNSGYGNRPNQSSQNPPGFSHPSDIASRLEEQTKTIKNLERQLGQLAEQLASRPPGHLPSFTEKNPRGGEQVSQVNLNQSNARVPSSAYNQEDSNAISLRSGTQLPGPQNQGNH